MAKSLSNLSYEELEAKNADLSEQKAAIREEQLELNEEITKRVNKERAQTIAETLSDDERAALAQVVNGAGGVDSQEASG